MKLAILSDVHSNADALEAVLEDARTRGAEQVLCLGDCVGYGPEPRRCLELLFERCTAIVAGNHDLAAAGRLAEVRFTALARSSVAFTRSRLRRAWLRRLGDLPCEVVLEDLLFVHASAADPRRFPYVREPERAAAEFAGRDFPVAFYGHTHLPMTFSCAAQGAIGASLNPRRQLDPAARWLVNVGSVGQPRDCDPRASYALFDTASRSLHVRRVAYDVDATTRKIAAQGLPSALGQRLLVGV